MKFVDELQNYLKARYPLILIKSTEEDRLSMDLREVAKSLKHDLVTWSIASGLKSDNKQFDAGTVEPKKAIDICESLAKTDKPTIFVFYDIVPVMANPQSGAIYQRRLKEFALNIRTNGYRCNCILVSTTSEISGSINSEITVLDYPLPNRQEVSEQVNKFVNQYKDVKGVTVDTSIETLSALTNAALGLTYAEIENCLARALVEDHRLDMQDIKSIVNEKKQIIRKSGILEYVENKLSLDDVGGLNVLKRWLELRGKTFSDDAKAFGLNPPKGVLLVGIPGCGKSLTAKCIASAWNMPLLKLDMGKIFGKYVGDSEANIRQALKTAEAIAPCVLWIDEIEKGMAGGANDGGTSSRVFGNILTWMQDKTSPVFTFATANNIRNLPPELLRKGRFDEIFFVDLPDYEERKKILEIHIGKLGRDIKKFDLDKLARLSGEENLGTSVRLAGAEIEAWVKDSLMEAYARKTNGDAKADLSMEDFEAVLQRMVPMAKMRQEDFKDLRDWANENAVSASVSTSSGSSTENSLGGRKIDLL
ncbi:AAA family ATPase [bacterium]|nr:AAA family ATPase [bacterium]MBR2273236.1 AAA family ATPase [Alphaproteobacteria bacterium]